MNTRDTFFTIITVCYNSEVTIQRTITSVYNQTFKNYEYIIIDGKSTDNTINIIESNIKKFKGKLRYISESDSGIYDAMNKGISMAKGKYIGLINSDDWYEKDALDIIHDNYQASPSTDIFYGLLNFYKDKKFYKTESFSHEFLNEESLPHPTCFISNNLYKNIGSYNTDYTLASDYEYFLRCLKSKSTFKYISKILANFSWDGATIKYLYNSQKEVLNIKLSYSLINKKQFYIANFKLSMLRLISNIRKTLLFWL